MRLVCAGIMGFVALCCRSVGRGQAPSAMLLPLTPRHLTDLESLGHLHRLVITGHGQSCTSLPRYCVLIQNYKDPLYLLVHSNINHHYLVMSPSFLSVLVCVPDVSLNVFITYYIDICRHQW